MSDIQWPKEQPKQQPKTAPKSATEEDIPGQPNEVPKDTVEELIRRFYTGGLPREEFATRMRAIGADPDMPPALPGQQVNPDPNAPGRDTASRYPGATHKL
jgi:hypothetical protein